MSGETTMKYYSSAWQNTLSELNDFSCQIEFLQSRIRNQVSMKKQVDFNKYIEFVKKLVVEHEHNLYLNYCDMKIEIIRNSKIQVGSPQLKEITLEELCVDNSNTEYLK